jgi:NAD-dependent DNA ligase
MDKIIKKLLDPKIDIITYATSLSIDNLEKIIIYAANKYYNTASSIISDEIYDTLIDILKKKNPNSLVLKKIGAHNIKNKVKLDYWLGSMNKIKPTDNNNELVNWTANYKQPYNISDKLDGVSALLVYNNNTINMYTRGDGNNGTNITHLLDYIKIPNFTVINNYCNKYNIKGNKNLLALRGELVIKKHIFLNKWSNLFKNPRSTVAGVVNSKKLNIKLINDIELVLYEIVDPLFSILKQFQIIEDLQFNLVDNIIINHNINFKFLSNFLIERREKAIYQIDGIIVTSTTQYTRNIEGNPTYAFAYKDILEDQIGEAKVKNIEWNISKDGYIIPTIIIDPIEISGITIKRTAGFNARFIVDNKLGPGAIIQIIRSGDVIPYITKIIKPSIKGEAELPKIKWHWNESNIDIKIDNIDTNPDVQIKNIYHFFSTLKTKGLGEKNIKKLYNAGFTSVDKILNSQKSELLLIDNFGEKMVNNILSAMQQALNNISLSKLMAASNKLGHGLGEEKIEKVITYYPSLLSDYKKWTYSEFINNIKQVNGWDTKTATLFVNNFQEFINFYNIIKKFIKLEDSQNKSTKLGLFTNKIIVFSGFRNSNLEQKIKDQGGNVSTTISKKIDYLIIKNKDLLDNPTDKILKAKEYNIKILTLDKLLDLLN